MIYLIGGSARCGKSTLARKMRKNFDGQVLSGDSMRVALRGVSKPEWHPDIFDKLVDPVNESDTIARRIMRLRRRDFGTWQLLKEYFTSVAFAGDNVLVDGIIWPSMLEDYTNKHRAVFLVDTSDDQATRMIYIRDNEQYGNWMKDAKYTDEKIRQWADFNNERSRAIIAECKKYNYPHFDIAEWGIDGAGKKASEYLFAKR